MEQSQSEGAAQQHVVTNEVPLPVPSTGESPVASAPVLEVPLSRRERRLMERGGSPETFHPAQALITDVAARAVEEVTSGPIAAPVTTQTVPITPLPPVFGSPSTDPDVMRVTTEPEGGVREPAPITAPVRLVGDVPTTTSSLIVPTTPTIDMTSPLSSTGEVVVTGQITLPSSFAEQGTSPLLDRSADNDEVMDAYVTGEIAAMSKPVRASQAVSTKGDDTDILLVRKARWGVAAIVTVIVAAVLGVAAAGLLVFALMTDVIG